MNLSSAPEIAKAIHLRSKLFRSDEDQNWILNQITAAQMIVLAWRSNPDPGLAVAAHREMG
ncbi:hypothetical protein IU459_34720 [Nocardia amamiensis]|uniref:Uncharacterized protein n=1 Tax=Nocardia amamiensis TaxID=404578 RepID=A0ABS0D6A8_9NOCA|nr:hypothetical protein [Nocardia amamiensis]MBF6302653.1 hypothetical protein [Nocardia amamiensis]